MLLSFLKSYFVTTSSIQNTTRVWPEASEKSSWDSDSCHNARALCSADMTEGSPMYIENPAWHRLA